jgi:hypothetical protein
MATYTINAGPYESRQLLQQALAVSAVGMLQRTDQGMTDAPGYTVMIADGWRTDNTGVEGVYCTVIVNDAVATSAAAAIAALGAKVLPEGNTPNKVLGLPALTADDVPARIQRTMERRLFNVGFDIGTGAAKRWYYSDPGYTALYALWNSLAARLTDAEFSALTLEVQHMDGRKTALTRALALTIASAAAQSADQYRVKARQSIAAWTADAAAWRAAGGIGAITWPKGYGE